MIVFCESQDDGLSWKIKSVVCPIDIYQHVRFYESHLVELPSGKLLGLLRANALKKEDRYLYQVESIDKGNSWTSPQKTTIWGLPPHLLLHSSGVLILVYGHRRPPYGQRAAISHDEGNSWQYEMILSEFNYEEEKIPSTIGPDDRPGHSIYYQVPDLGYPSSVELSDGTIIAFITSYLSKVKEMPVRLENSWICV